MSRSVGSLTRSTSFDAMGIPVDAEAQSQTEGLSPWVPINAGLIVAFDPYAFRSEETMGGVIGLDLRAPYVPFDQVKAGIAELKSLRPYWLGDYYPLTEMNLDEHAWSGWEFYRADLNAGYAVLFRRSLSTEPWFEVALRGVDPAASYDVTFARTYEVGEKRTMTGQQLQHLRVEIDTEPGSVLIRYQKAHLSR
jgi:alpha-galactosidase